MDWLPLILSLACGLALAAPAARALVGAGVVRANYRGTVLPAALGVAAAGATAVALGPLAALGELADAEVLGPETAMILVYALGVALLGLVDDLLGGRVPAGAPASPGAPRGWRGHGGAVAGGRLSTGALKAAGALGLALYALSGRGAPAGEYLLSVAVLVLATNAFNLLDLRPGRAIKALVVLGAALTLGAWDTGPLRDLGIVLGGVLALAPSDLRERAMIGDTGSNLAGAVAGLWLVLTLSVAGQAAALAILLAVTVYGEFRSISTLVEKNPLLRRLDSVGRRA